MRVWRLESDDGLGPFVNGISPLLFTSHTPPTKVGTEEDQGRALWHLIVNRYVCGWSTHDLMSNFPAGADAVVELHERGLHVREYDVVDHILLGDGQILFDRTTATPIATHSPITFFAVVRERQS